MSQLKKDPYSSESWAFYWDGVWAQKDVNKKLKLIRKKEELYFNVAGILSKFLNKYIKKENKYSIIELGCGGSAFLPYLLKKYKNLSIYGLDKSLSGCEILTKECEKSSNLNILCGDVLKPPFSPCSFDIVFSVGLIEHFKEPYEVMKKHVELLKPGGLLICIVPNLVGLQRKFLESSQKVNPKKDDNWIFGMKYITPEDFKKWLEDLGCKQISIKPVGGIHPFLMLESYYSEEFSKQIKIQTSLYQIFLSFPLILYNLPFMFRLNSINGSPFIAAVCVKNSIKV